MTSRDTPQAIDEAAARWVARLDAGPLAADTKAELDRWLAGDDRRRGALFRATVAWRMLDRASVLAMPADSPMPVVAPAPPRVTNDLEADVGAPDHPGVARRWLLWGGGAVAASLMAAVLAWQVDISPPGTPGERVETALGEIRRVALADGSRATLNTASALDIRYDAATRTMDLQRGEAWFEVAKDARRPFLVEAGAVRVRAVGTAFSVRRTDDGADVRVTEGTVEVWSASHPARQRVTAGAHTFIAEATGAQPPVADAPANERRLAWRQGALSFEGDRLGAAAAQFNRYNRVVLRVDPALADEQIVGRFNLDEPDAFARAVAITLGAKVSRTGDTIQIDRP